MSPRSAAAQAAPLWREVLERVLTSLSHYGPVSARKRVARAVERALASMQRLEETGLLDPRHLGTLDDALEEIERASEAAGTLHDHGEASRRLEQVSGAMRRARSETLEEVVRQQAGTPRAAPREPIEEAGLRASIGVPHTHRLVRSFVKPTQDRDDIDLDEAWRALEREAADAEKGEPIDDTLVVPGGGEQASSWDSASLGLRPIARDALEDIGVMGLLRRARGRAPRHDGIAHFEQRLLDNVDALMALSYGEEAIDVLAEARRFADDAFTYDPMRAFARTFFLGCVDGADPVRAALGALRRSWPYTRDAQVEALALAPNPEVGAAMRRLCAEADPVLVRAALEVLRFRGESDFGTAAILLSHTDSGVRGAAARCLALCDERDAARGALEPALADEENRECAAVMAEALLVLDAPAALAHVRGALRDASRAARPDRADRAYLRLLSVAGSRRDAELLASWASDAPGWIRAVGWFGGASLVPLMFDRHDGTHDWRAKLMARAIQRLSGETLFDEDRGSQHYVVEPRKWPSWWKELGPPEDKRLRFGEPYDARASIAELEASGVRGDDRDNCALELAILGMHVEPHTWVARQQEALNAARTFLEQDERVRAWHRAGEWLGERLGKRR
ncbi:MAG TPA: hypothetical protein VFB62_28255 [Polyangiaceae bacterium]|nr:hypothetical protein [Polyangiaceae bacterium]